MCVSVVRVVRVDIVLLGFVPCCLCVMVLVLVISNIVGAGRVVLVVLIGVVLIDLCDIVVALWWS